MYYAHNNRKCAEGAGEMFQVTTFDLKNVPLQKRKLITKRFFQGIICRKRSAEAEMPCLQKCIHFWTYFSGGEFQHSPSCR